MPPIIGVRNPMPPIIGVRNPMPPLTGVAGPTFARASHTINIVFVNCASGRFDVDVRVSQRLQTRKLALLNLPH
jgi:hypothetical protein